MHQRLRDKQKTDFISILAEALKTSLAPFTLVSTAIAAFVALSGRFDSLRKLHQEQPILLGVCVGLYLYVLTHIVLKQFSAKFKILKSVLLQLFLFIIILVGAIGVSIYPNFCLVTNLCGSADVRPFGASFIFTRAFAADAKGLEVAALSVDSARSSYRKTKNDLSIEAIHETVERIGVEYDRSMLDALNQATCSDVKGDQPILDALPVWRDILRRRGRNDLAAKLSDLDGYRNLLLRSGKTAFEDARPNASELLALSKSDPGQFSIMMKWAAKCIGLADPVIIWTLRNSLSRDLTLTSVDYNVLEIGQVAGGGPDVLEPIDVEPHDLYHKVGVQERDIEPKIVIHAGDTALVRIRYRLQSDQPGLTWLVQPTFRTIEGVSTTADAFKIFGAKYTVHN